LEAEQQWESDVKIEYIKQKEEYERHKKLQDTRNRIELLKQETDMIK
jgi:hypothetical protein